MNHFSNETPIQPQSGFEDNNHTFITNDNITDREYNVHNNNTNTSSYNDDEMHQFANNVLNEINNNQHVQHVQHVQQLNEVPRDISPEYLHNEQEILLNRQIEKDKSNQIVQNIYVPKNNNMSSIYKSLSVVVIFLLLNNSLVRRYISKYIPKLINGNGNELNSAGLVILSLLAGILYYISHIVILK
jgi:hypothetical protein